MMAREVATGIRLDAAVSSWPKAWLLSNFFHTASPVVFAACINSYEAVAISLNSVNENNSYLNTVMKFNKAKRQTEKSTRLNTYTFEAIL
jgi:hypothetical protein